MTTIIGKHNRGLCRFLPFAVKYRVFIKYCVFFQEFSKYLPPLPRQHSAAIGCTKNYQPIGVTAFSHCVESLEGLLQRCRRGRGCSKEVNISCLCYIDKVCVSIFCRVSKVYRIQFCCKLRLRNLYTRDLKIWEPYLSFFLIITLVVKKHYFPEHPVPRMRYFSWLQYFLKIKKLSPNIQIN